MRPDIVVEENYDADNSPKDEKCVSLTGENHPQHLLNKHFLNLATPEKKYENDAITEWVKLLAQNIIDNTNREQAIRILKTLSRADVSARDNVNALLATVYGNNANNYGVMQNPKLAAKYSNKAETKKALLKNSAYTIAQYMIIASVNFLEEISEHDKLLSFAAKPLLLLLDIIIITYNLLRLKKKHPGTKLGENFDIVMRDGDRDKRIINNTFKLLVSAALLGATLVSTYPLTAVYLAFFIYTAIDSKKKLYTMKSDIECMEDKLNDMNKPGTDISTVDKGRLKHAIISMQKARALEKEKGYVNWITIQIIFVGIALLTTSLAPIGLLLIAAGPILQSIHGVITKFTREEKEANKLPSIFDKTFKKNTMREKNSMKTVFIQGGASSPTPKPTRHNSMGG